MDSINVEFETVTAFMGIGMRELIVILLIVLVLFGAKKIPELARGLGKGIREFKNAAKDVNTEINSEDQKEAKNEQTTSEKDA